MELIKQSPSSSIRTLHPLANSYNPLAKWVAWRRCGWDVDVDADVDANVDVDGTGMGRERRMIGV